MLVVVLEMGFKSTDFVRALIALEYFTNEETFFNGQYSALLQREEALVEQLETHHFVIRGSRAAALSTRSSFAHWSERCSERALQY